MHGVVWILHSAMCSLQVQYNVQSEGADYNVQLVQCTLLFVNCKVHSLMCNV